MFKRGKRLIFIITLSAMFFTMSISSTTKIVKAQESSGEISQSRQEEFIKIIVELDESPVAYNDKDASHYSDLDKEKEQEIKYEQNPVIDSVEEITGTSVYRKFSYLVNGFSIITKRKNIDIIKNVDGVKSVKEAQTYTMNMSSSNEITQAANEWKDIGYKGEGMVISIIDSGIDYNHKDLKNIDTTQTKFSKDNINEKINLLGYGQYFTDKVPYGYNYADGNTNIIDKESYMHGMHVAGIAAANGDDEGINTFESIKGVAPQAQLFAMKVFSNNEKDTAEEDDIVQAIEDSVKLGADVINMSLGLPSGINDSDNLQQKAIQSATDAGVICVVAAGNDKKSDQGILGIKDNGTVSTLSAAPSSFSVGAMENSKVKGNSFKYMTEGGASGQVLYGSYAPSFDYEYKLKESSFEIVDCGFGLADEIKDIDLEGKIALIKEGNIKHQEKYDNVVNKNASGIIIYNDESGGDTPSSTFDIDNVDRFAMYIGYSDGITIQSLVNKGDNKFLFSDFCYASTVSQNNGELYYFTSWGTTSDLQIKPEIIAPGGNIYSLVNNNSYKYMSGTSMASPCVAGTEALILESVKKKKLQLSGSELVKFIKNTSMNTAKPLMDKSDSTKLVPYSVRAQGAGVIQAEEAVKNNVIITDKNGSGAAALKQVGNITKFSLTLTNYGDNDAVYILKDENVYGEETDSEGIIHTVKLQNSSVNFDLDKVTVKAGGKVTVNVTLNICDSETIDRFVEGYLNFKSEDINNPSLSVPFMGFYGDWNKENIVDTPNYEGSNSILKNSGLVSEDSKLCGTYKKDEQVYIDNDKVAFSPNGDHVNDNVTPMLYFFRNAKEVKIDVLDKDGIYYADIPFVDNKINDIKITSSDYAGNKCVLSKKDKGEDTKSVVILNLSDKNILSGDNLVDGKFVVTGIVGDNFNKCIINGENVTVRNNCFEHPVNIRARCKGKYNRNNK